MIKINKKHSLEKYKCGWVLHTKRKGFNRETKEKTTSIDKSFYPPNLAIALERILSEGVGKEKTIKEIIETIKKESKKICLIIQNLSEGPQESKEEKEQ